MKAESRKEWARNNATNILRVVIVTLFLGLAVWAITLNRYGLVIANHELWLWLTVALVSVGPELAGIVIGVVTIDYLNERRQREQLKAQLIRQMGMNIRDVAVQAARELAHHGWLYNGSLSGANLETANLSGANLWGADLSRTNLEDVNLSGADLRGANLRGADLWGTDLSGANLWNAKLGRAFLEGADLSRANLREANLSGAEMREADLSGAVLLEADLSGAELWDANLSGVCLREANLYGAVLLEANLSGVRYWTIEQLEQAETLEGAILPDKVQIRWEGTEFYKRIDGPTFEEWIAQYLAEHGGTVTDMRDEDEPDNSANGQSESGTPEPT